MGFHIPCRIDSASFPPVRVSPGTEHSGEVYAHRTWSVPDASSQPQLNLHFKIGMNPDSANILFITVIDFR